MIKAELQKSEKEKAKSCFSWSLCVKGELHRGQTKWRLSPSALVE
uniref:Uncharacterized protein n=1 Tax=Anguilla anguilla TaxID=7936 RepID=A0A0E9V0I4_ANGAN